MSTRVEKEGFEELRRTLTSYVEEYPDLAKKALYQEAQLMMNESKRIVPVDTGRLRSSGTVDQPFVNGRDVSVDLSYGTAYAIYVHENLDARHTPGKSAKFLEIPVNERKDALLENMVKRINQALEVE